MTTPEFPAAGWERQVEHVFVSNGEVRIHCAVIGHGPLIVLIHGFPDFWYGWHHQMPALAQDHRVVAMDLRGYNLSDKPAGVENYDLRQVLGDVRAVIRHFGAERAIVAGHDWGGAIAWGLALFLPGLVERLIVLNLPHPRGLIRELAANPQQHANAAYARTFQEDGAHHALTVEALCDLVGDPATRERYREALGRSDFAAMLAYYQCNYPRPPYDPGPWAATKVKAPTLLIHGLDDPYLLPGALAGTWDWIDADLTLTTIPGAGHWVHHQAADLVNRTMRAWLAR